MVNNTDVYFTWNKCSSPFFSEQIQILRKTAVYKPSKGGHPWVFKTYFIKPQDPLVSSKKHHEVSQERFAARNLNEERGTLNKLEKSICFPHHFCHSTPPWLLKTSFPPFLLAVV